jgi:hypothetical protein
MFMVATLLKKPVLAEHITSLTVTVTDKQLSDRTMESLKSWGWNIPEFVQACKERVAAFLPADFRSPYAAPEEVMSYEYWKYDSWHKLFDPRLSHHASDRENFYAGVLLSLLPNLQTLEIKTLQNGEPTDVIILRLLGWNLNNMWLKRKISKSGDRQLHTILDTIPWASNISKLCIVGYNYMLLEHGAFPNLRSVEAQLPDTNTIPASAASTSTMPPRRHRTNHNTVQYPDEVPYPDYPRWPRLNHPSVTSVRLVLRYIQKHEMRIEPTDMFLQRFPSCTRLRVDLAVEPHHYNVLLSRRDNVNEMSISYRDIIHAMHPVHPTLSTLIFSAFDPNPQPPTIHNPARPPRQPRVRPI